MAIISIFNGAHTKAEDVIAALKSKTGFSVIDDTKIIEKVALNSPLTKEQLQRAVFGKPSVFNRFTREKERVVALLKSVVAEQLISCDKCIFSGYLGQLIPKEVTHALRVLIIADSDFRQKNAAEKEQMTPDTVGKILLKSDECAFRWTQYLYGKDAWDASLYDIVVPMEKTDIDQTVELILENLEKEALKRTTTSQTAAEDFAVRAEVEKALINAGHDVDVNVSQGNVVLTINRQVLLLSKLEDDLKSLVIGYPGVESVTTKVGDKYHRADIYRQVDFEMPSKVLLVDDESEFVQVLSERLQARELGSHIVYDGQEALDIINDEQPEVMVLDLKMPGVDGMEVLRQTKAKNPETEVIILTGQGSESDKKMCMELGAFAYLEKPVDIELMAKTMKEAYGKTRKK
nr:response regulator [Desulfobulbaceae bacterium]